MHPELEGEFRRGFIFGATGPDIFYFEGKRGHALAGTVHEGGPEGLFSRMPELFAGDELERGYAMGLMLHYFGDRAIHPYIGWLCKKDGRVQAHVEAESAIEYAAYFREYGEAITSFDMRGAFIVDDGMINAAWAFWNARLPGGIERSFVRRSLLNMVALTSLLLSPGPAKLFIAGIADSLGGGGNFRAHFRLERGDALMNDAHAPWQGPMGISTESVEDIMAKTVSAFAAIYKRASEACPDEWFFEYSESFGYGCG